MGVVTPGIPREIVLELAKLSQASVFIETGTSIGTTTRWASGHFDSIFTIERSENLYNMHHKDLGQLKGVKTLQGDSRTVLPGIVAGLGNLRAVYWLDGHWSGEGTAGADDECPLLDELAGLTDRTGDIILIDDARLVLHTPPRPHKPEQWPTISEVIEGLSRPGCRRHIQIIDDVIFAIPDDAALKSCLIKYAQERPDSLAADMGKLLRRGIGAFRAITMANATSSKGAPRGRG